MSDVDQLAIDACRRMVVRADSVELIQRVVHQIRQLGCSTEVGVKTLMASEKARLAAKYLDDINKCVDMLSVELAAMTKEASK